jgi:4-diphosphocytidyl-2-C-methyl-D-erythritol kinase
MILFPQAKINLGLNVLSKRSDGYHDIETCMFAVPLYDVLEILPSDKFSFVSSGLDIKGEVEDNLCVKAYALLREKHNIGPVYMHLRKNIPMGAGLGGGSSDASNVLVGLSQLFDLNLSVPLLEEYAAVLGSDCPFFIKGGAQIAKGRGEVLAPLDLSLKGKFVKLVNPGIHISTSEAYKNVLFGERCSLLESLQTPIGKWQKELINSFEDYVFEMYPEVASIKQNMLSEGALFSAMSGSGSTIFAIYDVEPEKTFEFLSEWVLKL